MRLLTTYLALLLGTAFLLPGAASAQTIRGTVVDDETREPVAGVYVEARSPRSGRVATTQTNAAGHFLLHVTRSGPVTLHLAHVGFRSLETDTLRLQADEALQITLRLGRATIPLQPLEVTARSAGPLAGFYERMNRPGPGRFVTRADIERRPGAEATGLLRELPGVELLRVDPPPSTGKHHINIYLRAGAGRCVPTIFIDNILVEQRGNLSSIDELIRPEMLEGVEVHIGTNVPSPLYTRDGCGVVAFWSRRNVEGRPFRWTRLLAGFGSFVGVVLLTRGLTG